MEHNTASLKRTVQLKTCGQGCKSRALSWYRHYDKERGSWVEQGSHDKMYEWVTLTMTLEKIILPRQLYFSPAFSVHDQVALSLWVCDGTEHSSREMWGNKATHLVVPKKQQNKGKGGILIPSPLIINNNLIASQNHVLMTKSLLGPTP